MTLPELAADALGKFLGEYMQRRFGSSQTELVEMVPSIARIAIECIGNSDALYHNVEHTMLVTLAGHDILRGRALHAHMSAEDYAHVIIACLTHDIGYVRGLFDADELRHGIHGGAVETSIMLAKYPQHVRKDAIADFKPASIQIEQDHRLLSTQRPAPFAWQAQDLNPSGAIGDATKASADKGEQLLEHGARAFCELLADVDRFDPGVFAGN